MWNATLPPSLQLSLNDMWFGLAAVIACGFLVCTLADWWRARPWGIEVG